MVGTVGIAMLAVIPSPLGRSFGIFAAEYPDLPEEWLVSRKSLRTDNKASKRTRRNLRGRSDSYGAHCKACMRRSAS